MTHRSAMLRRRLPTLLSVLILSSTAWGAEDFVTVQWSVEAPTTVSALAFSPDGTRLVGACGDGHWRFWDANDGTSRAEIPFTEVRVVGQMAFSPDGELIAAGASDGALLLVAPTAQWQRVLSQFAQALRFVQFTPAGDRLVAASADGTVRVWDSTGAQILEVGPIPGGVQDGAISRDATRLATIGGDGLIRLWDLVTGSGSGEFPLQGGRAVSASYAPRDERIAVGMTDGSVVLWDLDSQVPLAVRALSTRPRQVRFSPDGNRLAVDYGENGPPETGGASVWDAQLAWPVTSLPGDGSGASCLVWHPRSPVVAVVEQDRRIRVWRLGPPDSVEVPPEPVAATVSWRRAMRVPQPAPADPSPSANRALPVVTVPDELTPVSVRDMRPMPLKVANLPAFLKSGFVYERSAPNSGDPATGKLEFRVERSGTVYLLANWTPDGQPPGGWREEIVSRDALLSTGWGSLGPCSWNEGWELFQRNCAAGESFGIRTRAFGPPLPVVAPPMDLSRPEHLATLPQTAAIALFADQVLKYLEQGEFARLDELSDQLWRRNAKFNEGVPMLLTLYEAAAGRGFTSRDDDAVWERRGQLLQDWLAQRPDSPAAHIALGLHLKDYGWKARGSGSAGSVTREGWDRFHERLEQAVEHLQRARELREADPTIYSLLIVCGMGLSADRDELDKYVERSAAIDPAYWPTFRNMAMYLLPRWHGSPEELADFANRAYELTRAAVGREMYAEVVSLAYAFHGSEVFDEFAFSWDSTREGLLDLLQRYPQSITGRQRLLELAIAARDRPTAVHALSMVGNQLPWPESTNFWIRLGCAPDVLSGDQTHLIAWNRHRVRSLSFAADGSRLIAASSDNHLTVWDPAVEKPVTDVKVDDLSRHGYPAAVVYSPDVEIAAVARRSGAIEAVSVRSGEQQALGQHKATVVGLEFARSGEILVSASTDGDVRIWDGGSGTLRRQINVAQLNGLRAIALSPDAAQLVTVGASPQALVWKVADQDALPRELDVGAGGATAAAFSQDGRRIAIGRADHTVEVRSTTDWTMVVNSVPFADNVSALSFSADGRRLAIGTAGAGERGGAFICTVEQAATPTRLNGHKSAVYDVEFARAGRTLATCGADWTIRLWDIQ